MLLATDGNDESPNKIRVTRGTPRPTASPPTADAELFANAKSHDFYWERHLLRLEWKKRWVGLAMGLRVHGEVHWWEYCRLVTNSESPTCREVEMAGAIPYELSDAETHKQYQGKDNPFIHKHNWVNGHIYARIHSNGVCEVYAHHINSLFCDIGADFENAVPVVGIRVEGSDKEVRPLCGTWDGTHNSIAAGGVRFDVTESSRLATPRQPGGMSLADGFLVWQPYLGVEYYAGANAELRTGDPYVFHAEKQVFPRGMARTLRFSLSLNEKRPPRVARYLAPAWWYGLCEEFVPEPILPVHNEYDAAIDSARAWVKKYVVRGGFEDGQIPNAATGDPTERHTPATEGDFAGILMHVAYRTGDTEDYDTALRASYNFIDTLIDHTVKLVRMQDYTPPAMALPLQRIHSCLSAWLETGDLYCLNAGRAVIDNAYRWHKNSWPRMAIGRDASFIHGAMLLWRYLADPRALEIARDTLHDLADSQWPDGTFGDQGGGAGMHGRAAFIIKPWMGWIATTGALDYLEAFPDDKEVLGIVEKFIAWSMKNRGPKRNGEAVGWTYQYPFHARPLPGLEKQPSPGPELHLFHFDYLARLLPFWSFRTGVSDYFDAFAQSYEGMGTERHRGYWDGPSAMWYLPWLAAKLWNARPAPNGGVEIQPSHFGPRTPSRGTILTPDGEIELSWTPEGKVMIPRAGKVKVAGFKHSKPKGAAKQGKSGGVRRVKSVRRAERA